MRAWYIPSHTGDFRLEKHPDDAARCVLTTEDMTPDEAERVGKFLLEAKQKGWVDNHLVPSNGRNELVIGTTVQEAGPLLAADVLPGRGVLTVVKSVKGTVMAVVDETEEPVQSKVETKPDKPDAAVTVRRHTTCCPDPIPVEGPLKRSSRVLREFCTPRQWRSWVKHGFLHCVGQLTGARYRLVHREHPLAATQGKICRDLTHGVTLHFYNCWVPPAEEILAAKLILENREPWLRNEATYFSGGERFKNPMGMGGDGTWDAGVFTRLGAVFQPFPQRWEWDGQILFEPDGSLTEEGLVDIIGPANISFAQQFGF